MNPTQAALKPGASVRILPAGDFRSRDGRPVGLPAWRIDGAIAANVIALSAARKDDFLIDFEHQSLTGKDAPAAGWFKRLEWREGAGLYMDGVSWTSRASAMLAANEYRYLSPVFTFNKDTGAVSEIINVALTNTPALDGLVDLAAAKFSTAALSVHFELLHDGVIASLRQQQGADHFKRVFGFDLPGEASRPAPQPASLSETIAKCSAEDAASLRHAFGHLA